jgi:hypothetical protein
VHLVGFYLLSSLMHGMMNLKIIIIIIIFLHGLGRLTFSGIDALPSFPGSSAIPSSPGFVGEGVFWESVVVHSFEVIDPVLSLFNLLAPEFYI